MPTQNTNTFLANNKVDITYFDASLVIGTVSRINDTLSYGDDAQGNIGDVVLIDSSLYFKDAATHWVSWLTTTAL